MSESKVVMVTGGARRIGAAIVSRLHGEGYRIVLHYHESAEEAALLAARLNGQRTDSVRLLPMDLSDPYSLAGMMERAIAFWGRLDGLVNNASAFRPMPVGNVTVQEWADCLNTNLAAPFFMSQAAAPSLKKAGGAIVNIVDIYAERPLPGYPVYSVTKTALAALTRSLAVELAPEIRVNGVSPGAILWPEITPDSAAQAELLARVPMKRCGEPRNVADTVLFLLRDAVYVTGQVVAVDGGRSVFI